jgi:beta-glucosidase
LTFAFHRVGSLFCLRSELGLFTAASLPFLRHGLKTLVTLQHFTSPRWLAANGGFENPNTAQLFAKYAERVTRHCGDLIDAICTINEANLSFSDFIPHNVTAPTLTAVAERTGSKNWKSYLFDDPARSKPIVRDCHRAARAAIKAVRPDLPVGLTVAMSDIQDAPGAPGAGIAERAKPYDVWLELARDDDFIGVQNYSRERFNAAGSVPPPAEAIKTQLGQEYYPAALANAVRYAAQTAKVPIYVTENGIGIEDDSIRARYIQEALVGLQQCIADGIDVRGYWHWSAMDNFEWAFGYGPKFGLISVDRATQARTPKPSAKLLGNIARRNAV